MDALEVQGDVVHLGAIQEYQEDTQEFQEDTQEFQEDTQEFQGDALEIQGDVVHQEATQEFREDIQEHIQIYQEVFLECLDHTQALNFQAVVPLFDVPWEDIANKGHP